MNEQMELNELLFEGIKNTNLFKVRMALDLGADVETRDKLGVTPLMLALFSSSVEIFELLICAGANINARDSYGNNLLDIVPNDDIYDILSYRGG